ncbi:hypothetical protein HOK09_03225 [Candidatus Woesearchaeota archaeon]|jgi:hypothetical protein|nr:hypothetical protein [Candidatus Woesearchaeota archaeon]MBT6774158.1 hypothetical protein [Candidatus Woesearchaeota archaeon]
MKKIKLKKGKSLEESLSGHTAQVEDKKGVEVAGDSKVGLHLKVFESFLDEGLGSIVRARYEKLKGLLGILTPGEAEILLQASLAYVNEKDPDNIFGEFFRRVIQTSYGAGHNDFEFDLSLFGKDDATPIFALEGKEHPGPKLKIKIKSYALPKDIFIASSYVEAIVEGDVGKNFAYLFKVSNAHIKGKASYGLGHTAVSSKFFVEGDVDHNCGYKSSDCYFDLRGKVNGFCLANKSDHSTFRIEDLSRDYKIGKESRICKFISPNEEVIKSFYDRVPRGQENRIFRELEDGKLQEVTR